MLPKLLELNTPEVILPILGWFFSAPLKPRIHKALGHYPILCVWGTQGSGKSSIVMEVFWPLFGIRSAEPFSATETEFALLKLLSSTNSVPVFIDEYKPFDMPKHRRHTLHRYMRRLYTGEVESRGRADQTVVSYRLHAPLCLAGETRPIESALVERIVTANPSNDTLPSPTRRPNAPLSQTIATPLRNSLNSTTNPRKSLQAPASSRCENSHGKQHERSDHSDVSLRRARDGAALRHVCAAYLSGGGGYRLSRLAAL